MAIVQASAITMRAVVVSLIAIIKQWDITTSQAINHSIQIHCKGKAQITEFELKTLQTVGPLSRPIEYATGVLYW